MVTHVYTHDTEFSKEYIILGACMRHISRLLFAPYGKRDKTTSVFELITLQSHIYAFCMPESHEEF
jgi:hypothetical protein